MPKTPWTFEQPCEMPEEIRRGRPTKYRAVWDRVAALKPGQWLPVVCETEEEVDHLDNAARTHRAFPIHSRKRVHRKTVYLSRVAP